MKGHILVVDDDRTFRLSTIALLGEEGHDVDGAGSAAEARQKRRKAAVNWADVESRMRMDKGYRGVKPLLREGVSRRRGFRPRSIEGAFEQGPQSWKRRINHD